MKQFNHQLPKRARTCIPRSAVSWASDGYNTTRINTRGNDKQVLTRGFIEGEGHI